MKYLAPSILSADFSNLSQQIRAVEIGNADFIHCDIMDGKFVPNITFGPLMVKTVKKITNLPIDVHLMIEKPETYLEEFVNAGASYITVHQETNIHLDRTLNRIKELGVKAGVTINPATPLHTLDEVLDIADLILIMSVNPGFGGQSFIESSIKKIAKLHDIKIKNDFKYKIEVDGGVNKGNIKRILDAGCDIFVIGSTIFSSKDITATTTELKNLISF